MKFIIRRPTSRLRSLVLMSGFLTFFAVPTLATAQPSQEAISAFNAYVGGVESRLARQHQSPDGLFAAAQDEKRLREGELIIAPVTPVTGTTLPGALLHDWRGTAFAAGAKAADFKRLMKDIDAYPIHFSPEVLQARVLMQEGDHLQALIRVRQKHVLTVVLDTTYDITFGGLGGQRGYSTSRSTKISEIASPGAPGEHALSPQEDHGFLWRLNTYWTYEERDGGLYMQIESVSLTRSVPSGLNWIIRPFIEKIPQESLEFTLRATCNALRRSSTPAP